MRPIEAQRHRKKQMQVITPEFLANIPNTAAMLILVALLLFLRRRHPKLAIRGWLLALGFIFVYQLAWFLGASSKEWMRLTSHALILYGEILAALTLACYRHTQDDSHRVDLPFVILNTIPLLVFSAFYGYYVFSPWPYAISTGAGILLLLGTTAWRKKNWLLALAGSVCLFITGALAWTAHYRGAQYWLLFCIFVVAIGNLRLTLPPKTLGRFVILASMSIWALSFLVHPWIINIPLWRPFADELWDLQKFFLCIGLLLVLLEDQVASTQWLALHDQLTDLPNRRLLDDWLENAITEARRTRSRLTVLLVDLDGFKAINDSCGHPIGDWVLCETARRMEGQIDSREMLARLGGDEFVIVSPLAATDEAIHHLETRLRQAIEEPLHIQGKQLSVGGTFGVAIYPDDTRDCDPKKIAPTLLRISDQRMYLRKTGRKIE